MKFVAILFLMTALTAKAQQIQQLNKTVTLQLRDVEFSIVLNEITKQTGAKFIYASDILNIVGKVTLNMQNVKLRKVLDTCLKNTKLIYESKDMVIGIRMGSTKSPPVVSQNNVNVKVTVLDERGVPLSGAYIKSNIKLVSTDAAGEASFLAPLPASIKISAAGYISIDTLVNNTSLLKVQMRAAMARTLDEVLVIAYGNTTRRLTTGDIGKISEIELENHRAGNILATLSGRIPRLLITQTSGLPESYFKVQLDGQVSVGTKPGRLPFTDPLYIVDGVPFAPNNNSLQILSSGSALGAYGRSPMSFIDADHIASIDVLKDADATAIYGSRGARGVIVISTKQGMPGKLKVTADVRFGIGMPTRLPVMLNTEQYLQMRNEAVKNDTVSPLLPADKDLLLYSKTWNTNFKKELLSKRAKSTDAVYSFSGGSTTTRYYFGANYHEESTVFPGSLGNRRYDLDLNINYRSPNQKLNTVLSINYLNDNNDLITTDLTQNLLLPPNSPPLRNSENKINWGDTPMAFNNPLASVDQKYHSKTENKFISLLLNYRLFKKWSIKATLGYNSIWSYETSIIPIISLNPTVGSPVTGTAYFGDNAYNSFIAEPHIEYNDSIGRGRITVLAGNSWQRITNENSKITALGYPTDENYSDTTWATQVTVSGPPKNRYEYQGLFNRVSYNWQDKYIANLTGRMDWSNRYGITRIRKSFAAAGAAWIFSNESFFQKFKWISFGKLRASYGITGNDPIGDMQYFDGWSRINANDYLDQLTNAALSSELTRKLNGGLELGFLHDRLFLNITCYSNRTSNLLVSPDSSVTAGGIFKLANWPAKVQNAGFDLTVRYENQSKNKVRWSGEVILTIPRNKLISFPNLASSPYAKILKEGKSLTLQQGYHYTGVNPATGVFSFEDKNNDNKITYEQDLGLVGNLDPKVYGGLKYDMSYRILNFGFFVEGRMQKGYNYLNTILVDATPGMAMLNQPVEVLDRWQRPGDKATFQQFTTGKNSDVLLANLKFTQSDGRYADASFLRIKNIYLSSGLPVGWLTKLHLKKGCIYFQANNAFTITSYKLLDPETQTFTALSPLKTFLVGLKFSL